MRTWVKDNPVSEKRRTPGSVAKAILDQPPEYVISFTEHPDANPQSREKGLLRWQTNPEPCWGPKAKAKRALNVDLAEKRAANQGKSKKMKSQTGLYINNTMMMVNEEPVNVYVLNTLYIYILSGCFVIGY